MQPDNRQKNYIKKNINRLSLEEIASDINLPPKEILNYLEKKWRKEKYRKYLKQINQKNNKAVFEKDESLWEKNRKIFFLLAGLVLVIYFRL